MSYFCLFNWLVVVVVFAFFGGEGVGGGCCWLVGCSFCFSLGEGGGGGRGWGGGALSLNQVKTQVHRNVKT